MTKLGCKRKGVKKGIRRKQIKIAPLDQLFSLYIRTKAEWKCEFCGKDGKQLHCHHGVVHRRYRNTRFEEDNCAAVCVSCHWFLGDFPQQNNAFFVKRIGSKRVEELEILARSGNKPDLALIKAELERKLEGLK